MGVPSKPSHEDPVEVGSTGPALESAGLGEIKGQDGTILVVLERVG
jgi:hypothetical protein